MKINKIYISAFGKLKDYTLELNDGLNVVFGNNENGKTTVMAFIKMMFYGTSGKKAQQLSSRPRVKYMPWSGENMGGRIYFENESHHYCLERQFGKSDSTDRIRLTDTDMGTDLPASADIGTKFFGLSAAAFERSVFIDGNAPFSHDADAEGELNMRLSNLAVTGDEDTSYQQVINRLESAKYDIVSKNGKLGKMKKSEQLLESLKSELTVAETAAQKRMSLNSEIEDISRSLKLLKKKNEELSLLAESENSAKLSEKISEYLETKAELDDKSEKLRLQNGTTANELFVKELAFSLNKAKSLHEKAADLYTRAKQIEDSLNLADSTSGEQLQSELLTLNEKNRKLMEIKEKAEADEKELSAKLADAERNIGAAQNARKKFNPALLIAGIVLILAGAGVLFVSSVIGGIIIAVGAVSVACSLIIKPLDKSAAATAEKIYNDSLAQSLDAKAKRADIANDIAGIAERLNLINTALNSSAAVKEQRKEDYRIAFEAAKSEEEKEKAATAELLNFFGKYKKAESISEVESEQETLAASAEALKQLKLRLGYLSRDLGNISYDEAHQKLEQLKTVKIPENTDFEQIKNQRAELSDEILELTEKRSSMMASLKSEFSGYREPENIRKEIDSAEETVKKLKSYYNSIFVAAEALTESFSQIRHGYGSLLEKKTLEIFSQLTGGRYNSITVSKSLELNVEQSGIFGMKEIDYLSSGTTDQAYLSLRLAISALMTDDATMPVFLDDSLSQYDDTRIRAALNFLKNYSCESQMILFTCHGEVCKIAEESAIKSINM